MKFRAFIDGETERLNGINQIGDAHHMLFEDHAAWAKTRVTVSNSRNIIERDYETKI